MLRNWLLVILAFTLSACGPSMYVKEMESPKHAMVFGHIEAGEGPMYFHWVQLKHTDAAGNVEYYTTRSDEDGMFYAENVPMGKYQIHRIGRDNSPMGPNAAAGSGVIWSLGEAGKDTAMRVNKPGVHYFGAFKYIYIEAEGFFGRDSFNFERASKPSEKVLLERLVKYTKDTRWEAATNKRLAALK